MLSFIRRRIGAIERPAAAGRGRLVALVLMATVMALAVPQRVHPQVLYGTLTGNVTDTSGGGAAGAKVQALNVGTNVAKSATTDDRGVYLFSDLLPGVYDVTFETPGFKTLVQKGVRVDSNAVRRVDARLEVSGISETVEVVAVTAPLQTDRADIHVTQTARQVNDLPLMGSTGRNYQSLMQIVPGAVIDRAGNQGGPGEMNSQAGSPQRSMSFNVNGVSRMQNQTKVDGASVVYVWLPTNTAYVPSAEAIEEVSIVTNSYAPEQGLAGGAAVNVVVKSGTNKLHGTAWGYSTNSELRARNYFQTTPQNNKNILAQFGGNLGGPIIKDKLFFFANVERTTQRVNSPIRLYSLPPADLRAGDFSATGVTIYDPASNANPALRTPFPGNVIPAGRIDPAALWFIENMPMPTTPGYANNYTAQGVAAFNRTNMDFKVNYSASKKLSLFARYSNSPHNILDPPALEEVGGDALNGGNPGNAPGRTQVLGVGVAYTLSPNLQLDANFGFTHQVLGGENLDIDKNYGLEVLNIPGTNGPDRLQGGIPGFQITNWANMGNTNTGSPFQFRDNQYVASVNLSWFKGPHMFRAGFDYQNQQMNHFQPQGGTFQTPRGTFGFNGQTTMLQNAPAPSDARFNSWAAFLLGLPSTAGKVDQLRNPNSFRMKAYAAYVQDTWQATRALTFTYGLRWEIYPFPTRGGGLGVSRFDPEDGNVYNGGVGDVPVNTGASSGSGRLLPRAGLAYRLNDKTVARAGYGQTLDPRPFIDFRNAYPIVNIWSHPTATFNGVNNAYLPVTTLRQGLNTAVYGAAPDLGVGVMKLPSGVSTTTYPKKPERNVIHSWNVMVQRELASWLTAQVGYVGTRAIGQMGFVNINTSAPGTGNAGRALASFGLTQDINMIKPFGDTTYNGLQAELRGRMASAQFGVAYTLSKTTNYADNDANPRIPYPPAKELNKAVAGYDRTHNLQAYWACDLPFGRGRRWATGGLASALFGGWQLNGLMSIQSGQPINIVQGTAGNLLAQGSGQYPDKVKDVVAVYPDNLKGSPPAGADRNTYQYFDRSAFAAVSIPAGQEQRFGNAGRNPIRGPGFWNVDLGLFRTFTLARSLKLQLRAEALNALNHPNFAQPGNDVSNAGTFGFITSTTGVGERNIRLGARLLF
jgi:hypothetical protein